MYSEQDIAAATAIVNIFETGKPIGDYAAAAVLDDGAGVSYGIGQFTHRSGALAAVVRGYVAGGGSAGRRVFEDRLPALGKKDGASIGAIAGDAEFAKALRAAAATPEMHRAQDEVLSERYMKPALDICRERAFTLPLSLAVVYDSMVHGSWKKIAEHVSQDGEKNWISEYVRVRDKWLARVPRLRKTRYRTKFFLDQINARNWTLKLPLTVNGAELARVGPAKEMNNLVNESAELELRSGDPAEQAQPKLAERSSESPPNILPNSTETGRPPVRTAPAEPEKEAGSGIEADSLDRVESQVNAAAARYDQAERIVRTVITRNDSAKSLWTTVAGTLWQTIWGVASVVYGMPRSVWLVVAVIAGALMVGYLYRQVELGKIRERVGPATPGTAGVEKA
jgi:chitosanase